MNTEYSIVLGVSRGGCVHFLFGWSWTGDWLLKSSLSFSFLLCEMLGGVENLHHRVIVTAELHSVSGGAL